MSKTNSKFYATNQYGETIAEFDEMENATDWAANEVDSNWDFFAVHESNVRTIAIGYDGFMFWPDASEHLRTRIAALESELAALKAQNAWTMIMTDAAGEVVAETLPERGSGLILFCIRDKVEEDEFVTAGSYDHDEGRWYLFTGEKMFMAGIVIYAWQPLPPPAIYGG